VIPYLDPLIDAIAARPHWAYAAAFLFAGAESLPVAGALVPGSLLVVALGALVPTGAVELWPLTVGATLGAVAADGLSFWLGRRYHREIGSRWPFRHYPGLIAQGESFLRAHGGKSVFLARFTPGVRGIVPLVAGIVRMPAGRFFAANGLSALAWAPSHVLAGVLVGGSVVLAGAVAARLALFLVVLLVALWLVGWLARMVFRRGVPLLADGLERAWAWARSRENWLSREVLALLDPARAEIKALLPLAAVLLSGAWIFLRILENIVDGDPLLAADLAIFQLLQSLRTNWGDEAMVRLSELGDGAVTVPIAIVVFLWLDFHRAWRAAAYWAGGVGLAALFAAALKLTLDIERPVALYGEWGLLGFPSGHTTVNTTIYGLLALLTAREASPRWRGAIVVGASLIVVGMAFSRLYLGAHWFSDAAAGLAFGLVWTAVLGIAYFWHRPQRVRPLGLLAVVLITLAGAGGLHVFRQAAVDLERYAVRQEIQIRSAERWSAGGWRELPARRIDLAGAVREPLTLQWVGDLGSLERELTHSGWRRPVPWTPASATSWLLPNPDPLQLPVLPRLHAGRASDLTLIRADAEGPDRMRLVLRLWRSDIALSDLGRPQPVFLGSVVEQKLSRIAGLMTVSADRRHADGPRQVLARSLAGAWLRPRTEPSPGEGWDGQILLAHDPAIARELAPLEPGP
jgi:undecaprenyl-diphosphatase